MFVVYDARQEKYLGHVWEKDLQNARTYRNTGAAKNSLNAAFRWHHYIGHPLHGRHPNDTDFHILETVLTLKQSVP